MAISSKLENNPNRRDVLDVCIGVITDKHGPVHSYEELVELLRVEFPNEAYTLDEVVDFFSLSTEVEDLHLYLSHINYDDGGLY